MNNDYLIAFNETCEKLNKMIRDKWLPTKPVDGGCIVWAAKHAPDLSKQEAKLLDKVNVIWMNELGLDEFKARVMDWGRTILKIYKQYYETTAVKNG